MLQIEVSIINSYMGEVQTTYNSQFRKATEQMESLRADVDTHSSTMKAEVHAMKDRVEALAAQVEALSERVITGVPTHHQAEVINSYMGEVQTTYNSQFRKATEQMESLRADVD